MDLLWNSMPNTSFTPTFKWFANIGCLSSFLWSKHELSVYLFIHLPLNAWNSEFFAVLFDNLSHILFRNSAKRRNRHLFGLCARERSVGLSFENLVNWLSCDHHLCRSLSVQVRRIGPSHTFRYFSFVCLFIQHQRPRRFVYLKCLNLIMHRSHDAAHCSRSSHWPLCRWQLMAARKCVCGSFDTISINGATNNKRRHEFYSRINRFGVFGIDERITVCHCPFDHSSLPLAMAYCCEQFFSLNFIYFHIVVGFCWIAVATAYPRLPSHWRMRIASIAQ